MGICGGFTTFSAFSLENLQYLNDGKYLQAIIYITASFMLSILATWLGYKCIA
jgi:CrcB protein